MNDHFHINTSQQVRLNIKVVLYKTYKAYFFILTRFDGIPSVFFGSDSNVSEGFRFVLDKKLKQ